MFALFFLSSCQTAEEKREQAEARAEKELKREAKRKAQAEDRERKIVRRLTDKCILEGYRKNTENLSRCVRVRKEDYLEDLGRYKSRYSNYIWCKRAYCLKSYARSNSRNPRFNCGANLVKKACGDKPIEPSL